MKSSLIGQYLSEFQDEIDSYRRDSVLLNKILRKGTFQVVDNPMNKERTRYFNVQISVKVNENEDIIEALTRFLANDHF